MENEKRLIEQFTQRLKEAYPQNDRNNPSPAIYYDDFCNIVDEVAEEMEAVDAVEVVRCRDCVYWENGKDYTPFCNRPEYGFHECPKPDDFCSYGERKLND